VEEAEAFYYESPVAYHRGNPVSMKFSGLENLS